MKLRAQYIRILFVTILLFGYQWCNSQKLIESRQSSYLTYIYKLSDEEAALIYKKDTLVVDSSYFHTLVDSFPTDSTYRDKLAVGHYLKTYSDGNKQKYHITTVQNFDVFILNNNTDLVLQVYDLQGKLIPDAEVKVDQKRIRFDKKTQSYFNKKSNQKGLLKVAYQDFTAYYNLNRHHDNSCFKRGRRKLVYGTPLKYVWMPVSFIARLPVDGVKSIVKGRVLGTIYTTKNFFKNSFRKIVCLFDDCYRNPKTHKGYMVFNKPKYLPGDTVKFKAFLVNRRGKALDDSLEVYLQGQNKTFKLTKLAPYAEGGYEYQFFLHDSLNLRLDRSYAVSLGKSWRKILLTGGFKYEIMN